MIISYAWTTDALLARRKTCTRRDWSKEYAARFRAGTGHMAYTRQARFGGKHIGDVLIRQVPYPERTRDIPDDDFEAEGFAFMEEKGLLIQKITPRQFFEDWRGSNQVLFVVRFDLVFKCDRCGDWTTALTFGPGKTNRLCSGCWAGWEYCAEDHSNQCRGTAEQWRKVYAAFCAVERPETGMRRLLRDREKKAASNG